MNNNNSKGVSYTTGFFMLIGFSVLGLVIAGIIGLIILLVATGQSIADVEKAMTSPENVGIARATQIISVFISMLLPAWIVASVLDRKPFQLLGFRDTIRLRQVGLVIAIAITALVIAGVLGYLNKLIPVSPEMRIRFEKLETSYARQVESMINLKSIGGYLMSLVIMAFFPAVCEEVLFRGGLQNFLARATGKPWIAIIVVSILFSLVHFSFYGFLPRMFLGIMLGLIFYYTGNIWLSIIAHFFNNALAVTQMYLLTQQGKNIKDAMNDNMPFYWGLIVLPFFILFFTALKKSSQTKEAGVLAD
jgi:hypothetical protein